MKNISSQKFGKLLAIEPTGEKRWGVYLWRCVCDCGKEKVAAVNSLVSGLVSSCGCAYVDAAKKRKEFHGKYGSKEYKSWSSMIQRCTNPKSPGYKNYGGRGIKVCERWKSFKNFFADMGESEKDLTLERINVNGDYEPQNCKWANKFEQSRNKRTTKLNLEIAKQIKNLYESGKTPKQISELLSIKTHNVSGVIWNNSWLKG